MRLSLLFIFCLFTVTLGCQHAGKAGDKPVSLDYDQLKSYLTQTEAPFWSSKARTKALGGYVPVPRLPPTFGMNFSEAKNKARVLDLRTEKDFSQYNLSMDPQVKIPVINIPGTEFFHGDAANLDLQALLQKKGLTSDNIVIVLCKNKISPADAAHLLSQKGFPRVSYYESGYSQLPGCD